jgi:aerobic-type carbon monoxide dehydrogenase small subunit (CoxS/CutS family)
VKSSENVVVNNMRKVNRVINGRARQFVVSPDRVLLDVLREDLHLTTTCAAVPAM